MVRKSLNRRLLAWYGRHARDLPWRRTRDPYAIWISEIMLQQTQVKTVRPYYDRFTARFPDVQALAAAEPDDVLRAWAGLGYYSRARNAHAAAKRIVADHGGDFPRTGEALRALPGIGRYTAGAILSIAYDQPAPVLDGNVMRVLARLFAIPVDPRSARGQTLFWDLAARLVPAGRASAWNQALMELGALVCVPADPACLLCPVRSHCRAWAEGDVARYPVRGRRRKAPVVEGVCLIARRGAKVLFVQRPEKGLLGGLWEFPTADLRRRQARAPAVRDFLWKGLGLRGEVGRSIGSVRHIFTHRDLRLHLYTVDVTGGRARTEAYPAHRWVNLSEVRHYPLSALTEKVFARLARPAAKGRIRR